MKYSKQFKAQILPWIKELRLSGMTWDQIQKDVHMCYPEINDISVFRKQITNELNNIAYAKANLLVNRKINIQMNRDLHEIANDHAKWEILRESLKCFRPTQFRIKTKPFDVPSMKDVIYVLGDIHFRGNIDNQIVVQSFSRIKSDIQKHNYKNVTLFLTGDNVDGEIHEEQTRTNQPVIDSTIQICNLLTQCLSQIPEIKDIYMVYGNHEEIRLWGDKNTDNNIGKFIAYALQIGLPDKNVIAGEELFFTYKDKKVLLLHGHQGYANSKAKLIEHCAVTYSQQPDYIILGHFHSSKVNQFSRNHWLITAPAVKNWMSRWDETKGFCGFGQMLKVKMNMKSPQITTLDV